MKQARSKFRNQKTFQIRSCHAHS